MKDYSPRIQAMAAVALGIVLGAAAIRPVDACDIASVTTKSCSLAYNSSSGAGCLTERTATLDWTVAITYGSGGSPAAPKMDIEVFKDSNGLILDYASSVNVPTTGWTCGNSYTRSGQHTTPTCALEAGVTHKARMFVHFGTPNTYFEYVDSATFTP